MTPELAAAIRAVWAVHDGLEGLLTEYERGGLTAGKDELWGAHDLVERATLKLHGLASAAEVAALQEDEA